jgi:quercetin dioxygenase-like cupin family protein
MPTGTVEMFRIAETEPESLHGGASVRRVITKQRTGADVTVSLARLQPGQGHSWHRHEASDEIICVLQGKGTLGLRDGAIAYEAGCMLFVPRQNLHQNFNTGTEEVVVLTIFSPAIR